MGKQSRKRKPTNKLWGLIVLVTALVNIAAVVAMLACAYSGMLPPARFPRLSALPLFFPYPLAVCALFVLLWLFIRPKYILISLIGMLLCITDIRAFLPVNLKNYLPEGTLKVLSYNIGNLEREDKELFIDYLADSEADIICFQEYGYRFKLDSEEKIKGLYPYSNLNGLEGRNTCLSKYPITGSELIKFDNTANSAAAFTIDVNGDTLTVLNIHLQSYYFGVKELDEYKDITRKRTSMEERERNTKDVIRILMKGNVKRDRQVEEIENYLNTLQGKRVILCGDFNETANGYAHYRFTKQLNDAYTRTGNGPGFSYNRNRIKVRIDHILCSDGIEPYECQVDNTIYVSDHFPIWARLKL